MITSKSQPVLTDEETLQQVINCLTQHLPIETNGTCDQKQLFYILVKAASNKDSIENTTKTLQGVSKGNNVRYHLGKINNFSQLESKANKALQSQIPPRLKQKHLKIAIDLNLLPYYGNPSSEEWPYIYRSQAKDGTCSFYAYATLYVIKKGKRVTLAIRGVRRQDTAVAIISYLLRDIGVLGIKIKRLYLDRGFFSRAVISWLQALDIPFAMPAIVRGKKGGIRQFLKGRRSYKTNYTMTSKDKRTVTFELWIICKYQKGKRGQRGIEYFVYIINQLSVCLNSIHEHYRQRFGIETSYRLKNQCLIKTTTKNPIFRLLFVALAFLLVNIWINLLWHYICLARRGGRLIYQKLFGLKQMLAFLTQGIHLLYPPRNEILLPGYG